MKRMDDLQRERLERRADEMIASLDMQPANVVDDRDLVVMVHPFPAPWVVPPQHARFALSVLGGDAFAQEILQAKREPGRLRVVVVIGNWIQVATVGLRRVA